LNTLPWLQAGGPLYPIELGRKDALTSYASSSQTFLPAFTLNVSGLLQDFHNVGLDLVDLVALSGQSFHYLMLWPKPAAQIPLTYFLRCSGVFANPLLEHCSCFWSAVYAYIWNWCMLFHKTQAIWHWEQSIDNTICVWVRRIITLPIVVYRVG
jgi:hypothetical protein